MRKPSLLIVSLSVASFACGGDLARPDGGTNNNNNNNNNNPKLVSMMQGDLTVTNVDASDLEAWIYMDLETGTQVDEPMNPEDSDTWDVAFQRFKVKLNGGVNGSGGVEVAQLVDMQFAAVTEAPASGYVTDAADGPDDGEIPDYAISFGISSETGPWAYDINDHSLSESTSTWVVKSVQGSFYKLRFLQYYSDAGDPGHPNFQWAKLDNQAVEEGVYTIELAERGFTYFSLSTEGTLTQNDPDNSTEWDFAIQQAAWATNSGGMRIGQGGAKIAETSVYDEVTVTSTSGFTTDEMIMFPGPPGAPMLLLSPVLTDWFTYDSATHTANPKDLAYVVRLADGSYAKMKILSYDDKETPYTYRVKLAPLTLN